MKPLAKRLARLENRVGWISKSKAAAVGPSGATVIAQQLAELGVVRQGNESLAETTARAFGWTMPQLRTALVQRSAGMLVSV